MLFNSYIFVLLFLPVVLMLWWSTRIDTRTRLCMLVAASYCFYGWWDFRFVGLLVLSTLVDYYAGLQLVRATTLYGKRLALLVSMSANLGFCLLYTSQIMSGFMNCKTWRQIGQELLARCRSWQILKRLTVAVSRSNGLRQNHPPMAIWSLQQEMCIRDSDCGCRPGPVRIPRRLRATRKPSGNSAE